MGLTYLRGLEIAELKEEDMPMVFAMIITRIVVSIEELSI